MTSPGALTSPSVHCRMWTTRTTNRPGPLPEPGRLPLAVGTYWDIGAWPAPDSTRSDPATWRRLVPGHGRHVEAP